jgi:hypothetical protein
MVVAAICAVYVVLGTAMEELSMILLTIPVFFPVIVHLGFDPIWFGIIIVCVVEIGLISPPVGMNMFVLKTLLPEVSTGTVFSGVLPFMWAGRHPARHPRGLPHHLSVAAEHDAVTERRALGWVAIGAVVAITWLALPFVTGLFLGALMAFTLEPVYAWLARRTRRPLIASLTVVVASALVIVGVVALFVSQFVTRGVALANTVREELRPGGAAHGVGGHGDGLARPLRGLPREHHRALRVGAGEIASRTAGMAGLARLRHLHCAPRPLLSPSSPCTRCCGTGRASSRPSWSSPLCATNTPDCSSTSSGGWDA